MYSGRRPVAEIVVVLEIIGTILFTVAAFCIECDKTTQRAYCERGVSLAPHSLHGLKVASNFLLWNQAYDENFCSNRSLKVKRNFYY
jgi:hypothetical protein